jgi:hypothetical protein
MVYCAATGSQYQVYMKLCLIKLLVLISALCAMRYALLLSSPGFVRAQDSCSCQEQEQEGHFLISLFFGLWTLAVQRQSRSCQKPGVCQKQQSTCFLRPPPVTQFARRACGPNTTDKHRRSHRAYWARISRPLPCLGPRSPVPRGARAHPTRSR